MRALITAIGLGANLPQDAVYPTSLKDVNRSDYHGSNKYVMRFVKGKLPPAEAFWVSNTLLQIASDVAHAPPRVADAEWQSGLGGLTLRSRLLAKAFEFFLRGGQF
jgi:hypothetical protein